MKQREHYNLQPEDRSLGWKSYPRPQFRRDSFYSLNGMWKMNGEDVRVPYPLQSELSGFRGEVPEKMSYEKKFNLPEDMKNALAHKSMRLILHFDGVDQTAGVNINGNFLGEHEGGYLSFSYDITPYVALEGENMLMVEAEDSLSHLYPYGKQNSNPKGIWYTPVSGIWKSVWLECVPKECIEDIKITPHMDSLNLKVRTSIPAYEVLIYEPQIDTNGGLKREKEIFKGCFEGEESILQVMVFYGGNMAKYWTPDTPYLYPMTVKSGDDEVQTYFALREVSIRNVDGINRLCLNGKPVFLHGVLDQGYFCDGIFTPGNEKEYERDILRMKELGFNTLRKHIKVEPDIFYYDCDRLGMMVVQDMVNNGDYSFLKQTALPTIGFKKVSDELHKGREREKSFFKSHMLDTMSDLYNHPSIVGYTIFNEGWGQVCSDEMYDAAKKADGTRFLDSTSGWFAQEKSDVDSLHIYFKTVELKPEKRPMFLSECGGFKYKIPGHYYTEAFYGYGGYDNSESLTNGIMEMYDKMVIPAVSMGLCGCIYTQLSDVEQEINGLYTYDRKVCKVDREKMKKLGKYLKCKTDEI